jgi:hypothetical protein
VKVKGKPKGCTMIEQQNVQLLEVRELTDGLWDGRELVVVEAPVKKKEKVSQNAEMIE